ncbi:unnamed protein product [Pieris macdunnoughi]|uniref:Tc1-like transposase DDE domain-containing protein n=1 Tax=Pieris macdunnoughi TaxID=345717 RepID=A0A821YAP5_9NEOP|nr:unnamed protein product [Pieris macdunnoughi]
MASRNLDIVQRSKILVYHEEGFNIRQISEKLGITRNTVRLWIRRYEEEGHLQDRPRKRQQPYMIGEEDTRNMLAIYEAQPLTPTRFFAQKFNCSLRTVRRALEREGKISSKVIMTETNKAARLKFAREFRDYNFFNAIFVDEKSFLSSSPGRRHPLRTENIKYEPLNVNSKNKYTRIVANMCGWMSTAGPGELTDLNGMSVNGESYVDLMRDSIIPTICTVYPELPEIMIFQESSPLHTSNAVKSWFQNQSRVKVNLWPINSPDLNPFNYIWATMLQRWDNNNERTREMLVTHCHNVWESMRGTDLCEGLIQSMKTRCDAVIAAHGAATTY